jgi:hypothetical protein
MGLLKIIRYWLIFADKTEIKRKRNWWRRLYFLLLPLCLLIDIFCFIWCWRVLILEELLTKEPAVKFFDDNEFGYRWWKLYKKDIIEPDSFLDTLSVDELKIQVEREMTKSVLATIAENTTFDIEEYVSLICYASIIPEGKLKMYGVSFQYYRYHLIRKNLFKIPVWIVCVIIAWFAGAHAVLLFHNLGLAKYFSR